MRVTTNAGMNRLTIADAVMTIEGNNLVFRDRNNYAMSNVQIELTEESVNDMRSVLASIEIPWRI